MRCLAWRRGASPLASGLSIDHVFASPGIAVTAWREILQLRGGKFLGVIPSDHNPVVADLLVSY